MNATVLVVVCVVAFLLFVGRSHAEEPRISAGPCIGMVMTDGKSSPDGDTIASAYKALFPKVGQPSNFTSKEGVLTFELEGELAGITVMPVPIPWSQLEGPCATAYWWPEATEVVRAHKSHLLVTLVGKSLAPIDRALVCTRLVAATVSASKSAVGVYWGEGTLVVPPKLWLQAAQEATREVLPLNVWIDFRINPNGDGTFSCFTTGMKAFGHMEIEVDSSRRSPEMLRNYIWNAAHYLLDNGPVLLDGQTFGFSAEDKISVKHSQSMWPERQKVIKLGL